MDKLLIRNARIISDEKIFSGDLLAINGKIAAVGSVTETDDAEVIDAGGQYLSAGFVDIHVHGGGGYDLMDGTVEALKGMSRTHLLAGTTTMLPTMVTSPFEKIISTVAAYKAALPECPNFAGLHLEGPFLSPKQKGAHNEALLHSPIKEETERLLAAGEGLIKRVTAAPELDGMKEFAEAMKEAGVLLSLGHSDATADVALDAFGNGFSHITHLYSATPTVRKINQVVRAGVIEAAYLDDSVTVELIADGHHAAVEALQLAVKIKGTDKVALVTDALRPAGTDVKESYLGEICPENRVILEDGVAKLPDRSSFAGSIATCAMLLERGVNHYRLPLASVVKMITETPACIMKLDGKGVLTAGADADLVLFGDDLKVNRVFLAGKEAK